MPELPIVNKDLKRCCLSALAKFDDMEDEGAHLICPKCSNRMRVKGGKWQRWFYWDELPPTHPERKRPKVWVRSPLRGGRWVDPEPTESHPALKGKKIPLLDPEMKDREK